MKAKWIDEITDIVASERFSSWFDELERLRRESKRIGQKHEELLTQVNLLEFRAELAHRKAIDTLERGNTLEDKSAELENQAAELENASFEIVSQYEMQRSKCTGLWELLGGFDVKIEDAKADGQSTRSFERQRAKHQEQYDREDQKKQRLWSEVERLWVRSIDCNLALRERKHKSTVVRLKAEALFQKHEEEAAQAARLREQAEKAASEKEERDSELSRTYDEARREFECLLTEDFLYWVAKEDNKIVYAVPLMDDDSNYVVPMQAGHVYKCNPTGGIDVLEPLTADEVDRAVAEGDKKADGKQTDG